MSDRSEIDRLLQIVTPEGGTRPEFHFYAARHHGAPPWVAPTLSEENTRTFTLSDESWAYQVDVFELSLQLAPAEIPEVLLRGLEGLVTQGAILAWLMFDGAFDGVDSLTTEWGAQNTYGIAGRTVSPQLALGKDGRARQEWRELIQRAAAGFTQR